MAIYNFLLKKCTIAFKYIHNYAIIMLKERSVKLCH